MVRAPLIHEELTESVIGAFYEVYNTLGYGFLEHVYMSALAIELAGRGHTVRREVMIDVFYKGHHLARQRLDMIVDDKLVVEGKSTAKLAEHASRQVFGYLHATRFEIGLLLHFGPEARFYPVACRNR